MDHPPASRFLDLGGAAFGDELTVDIGRGKASLLGIVAVLERGHELSPDQFLPPMSVLTK